MADGPGRHQRPQPLLVQDVADELHRQRWQREQAHLEEVQQDQRIGRRRQLVLILIVCFLLLDVAICIGVIASATS